MAATINSSNFGTGLANQVLTSNGEGVAPTFQTPSIANARVNVTTSTQAMAVNTTYTTNDAGAQVVYTLPATAIVGSVVEVIGNSADGWSIAQNASQLINIQGVFTTTGTGGSLSSTTFADCVKLVCVVTNTTWTAIPTGNLSYV